MTARRIAKLGIFSRTRKSFFVARLCRGSVVSVSGCKGRGKFLFRKGDGGSFLLGMA